MAVVKKFVIERADVGHFYTEKTDDYFSGVKYHIYDKANSVCHNPASFYTIYGTDRKRSIIDFINKAEREIIASGIYNEKSHQTMQSLEKVREKIAGKVADNPSLYGYKDEFVTAISNFNELKEYMVDEEVKENYEEELETLRNAKEQLEGYQRVRQDVA